MVGEGGAVVVGDEPALRHAPVHPRLGVLLRLRERRQGLAELDDVAVAIFPIVEKFQIFENGRRRNVSAKR